MVSLTFVSFSFVSLVLRQHKLQQQLLLLKASILVEKRLCLLPTVSGQD